MLKIRLYQETASYTKPFANKVGETYPLPPYSTVIGCLHHAAGWKHYHELSLSIQGSYDAKGSDYRTTYFYKEKEVTSMPIHIHYLYDVSLVLHVQGEAKNLEQLYVSLTQPKQFLSLGRHEDILRIDEVKWVEVTEQKTEFALTRDMYVPVKAADEKERKEFPQAKYRLNKKYHIVGDHRVWDTVDVWYASQDTILPMESVPLDDEGDVVLCG